MSLMKPIFFITAQVLCCLMVHAQSTYLVNPDGTGDFSTIQDAVDASVDGDTIFLGNGIFQGEGNFNIRFFGRKITVGSLSGDPDSCVIYPGMQQYSNRRAFVFDSTENERSIVRDLTIFRASALEL